jgi:hypothetical protein
MKIRSGFISNSSSSSFCILGKTITNDDYDKVDSVASKILSTHIALSGGDDRYVGASPERMKDDETLAQFKQRIVTELKTVDISATTAELEWITDGGYNG